MGSRLLGNIRGKVHWGHCSVYKPGKGTRKFGMAGQWKVHGVCRWINFSKWILNGKSNRLTWILKLLKVKGESGKECNETQIQWEIWGFPEGFIFTLFLTLLCPLLSVFLPTTLLFTTTHCVSLSPNPFIKRLSASSVVHPCLPLFFALLSSFLVSILITRKSFIILYSFLLTSNLTFSSTEPSYSLFLSDLVTLTYV